MVVFVDYDVLQLGKIKYFGEFIVGTKHQKDNGESQKDAQLSLLNVKLKEKHEVHVNNGTLHSHR